MYALSANRLKNKQIWRGVYNYGTPSFALQRRHPVPNEPPAALFLTAPTHHFTIHLESAAFVFHINGTTLRIIRSLRAACSEPVQRFLACPFS
jgi:hypothetical protein